MEASFFTQVLLPASLALIMFGMGLTLTVNDFQQLLKTPKAVSLGLFGQMICLPLQYCMSSLRPNLCVMHVRGFSPLVSYCVELYCAALRFARVSSPS